MKLLICGAGQYGFVAKEIAEKTGSFTQIVFLDDNNDIAIGGLGDIDKVDYDAAVVAIGNPRVREKLLNILDKPITLIDPGAAIMPSAKIGEGCIIEAGAIICSNATVGRGCIIMANAVVGHDASIGDYCHLKYNSTVNDARDLPLMTKLDCNQFYI